MHQIAIMSDIHGNITALEAVMNHIKSRGISIIICLGDLVGKGPSSKEAIDRIRESCEIVVRGNWDEGIQEQTDNEMMVWHQNQIGPNRIDYLRTLPFHYDFFMSGKYIRLFHASAKSVHHRVLPMSHPQEEIQAMFHTTDWISPLEKDRIPDIVGYGDIHAALVDPIDEQKTLLNVGSVGNPLDVPQATYVILHGDYLSKKVAPFSIEIVRVPYDIEKEIGIAKDAGMPGFEAYAFELRNAIYRWSEKGKEFLGVK